MTSELLNPYSNLLNGLENAKSNKKPTDLELLFENIPVPLNIHHQGQYSTDLAALSTVTISEIAYPKQDKRPPIKELNDMQERDPVVQQCIQLKALRAVQSFGNYSHPKKEIESFINGNLQTLNKSFKRTLFKMISSVILYGFSIAEYTLSNKARGYFGQTRLVRLNPLDPLRIISIKGRNGMIESVVYDNGDGKTINIPYKKCLHVINNCGATFDDKEIWGIGDGLAALNYYKLKRVVLTQLALATKNNSTGIVHAKVPNNGRTVLVDSKMNALKDAQGKPIETTKQIALNYQLQDLYKKDYIVTDIDVDINRIQIQNDERFWEYILNYIDRSIQRAFSVPVGIFDSGTSGIQNVGLSQNFKSVFDSTIFALTTLLKEELTNKIVKKLLFHNFPFDWFKNNYGDFVFDAEEDQQTINSRLSTISSLIASGILEANDIEVISLIKKNLGLPALDEQDKAQKQKDDMDAKIQKEVQAQLQQMQAELQMAQTQMQKLQTDQQLQMLQNPQMMQAPPGEAGAEGEAPPPEEGGEDYPEGA